MAKPLKQLDITDPMYRNFMCENYEKEQDLRIRWNIKYGDLAKKAATSKMTHDITDVDIYRTTMIAGLLNTTAENIASARNRRTKRLKDYVLIKDQSSKEGDPTMKPVEEDVTAIIKESNEEYLKVRNRKAPEDKYNFIETVNMRYGWELGKNSLKTSKAAYGRSCPLTNMIKDQHSGPQPDPDHYMQPEFYKHFCFLH